MGEAKKSGRSSFCISDTDMQCIVSIKDADKPVFVSISDSDMQGFVSIAHRNVQNKNKLKDLVEKADIHCQYIYRQHQLV